MVAKPSAPGDVVGPARRNDSPKPGPMAKHPEMRELMDDHGLEGFGGREDEAPGECEAALFRGAPPSTLLVADADRGSRYVQACSVPPDLALDLQASTGFQPCLKDRPDRTAIRRCQADDDLVFIGPSDAFDAGASPARRRRLDAEPVELATEAHLCAITEPTASGELGLVTRMPIQVATQPRLPLDQERAHLSLGIRPAATTRRWDGHDDATIGMDDDP